MSQVIEYSEKVMDHFTNPRNVGEIENASGVGTVGNAKCGDIMRIYLDIDDNQIIKDVKFKTFGCGAAVATSSIARFLVKPVKSASKLMPNAGYELPYEGAMEMLLVEDVDNKDFFVELFNAMYEELPAPKVKKKK